MKFELKLKFTAMCITVSLTIRRKGLVVHSHFKQNSLTSKGPRSQVPVMLVRNGMSSVSYLREVVVEYMLYSVMHSKRALSLRAVQHHLEIEQLDWHHISEEVCVINCVPPQFVLGAIPDLLPKIEKEEMVRCSKYGFAKCHAKKAW